MKFNMTAPRSNEEIERLARKRASAKLGWYIHLSVYLLVNSGLVLINWLGMSHRPWSVYPALGWGLGVVLHGVSVFVLGTGSGLRERMIQRERERLMRDDGAGRS